LAHSFRGFSPESLAQMILVRSVRQNIVVAGACGRGNSTPYGQEAERMKVERGQGNI
jgi:hypothetical protein